MNVLLDTHFILWYAKGDNRLPKEVLELIQHAEHGVFASEISLIEIEIKHAKNPASMPYSGEDFVSLCEQSDIALRPITREAILAYGTLKLDNVGDIHKDPFDRLLIAHAKSENLSFITHDRLLALYDEALISIYPS